MDLARFAIEKRLISALATLLILIGGYYAYTALPRFEDPEFIIRQAQIITPYPGASAEEVAEEVTDVVENTLQELAGVKEIKSVSSPGISTVTVEFEIAETKTRDALAQKFTQMRSKILDGQASLPMNALASQVYDDYGDVYALYYAVTGEGYTLPELHQYSKDLQRELVLVDGVSKVVLTGVQDEVIYVEYAPARLTKMGISTSQIASVLEGQNLVTPGGSLRAGEVRLTVRATNAVDSVTAIGDLVLANPQSGASFRLADIATVRRGVAEPASLLLYRDGAPAIGLGISNTIGGNVVEMGASIKARMDALTQDRPIGIEVTSISDQAATVKESISDFVMNVVVALAIVVGTLLIFMGLRSGILMGGILLVTVAGTLLGMYLYGLDMQRVSLGALIIGLGMLVDNAIVIVEGTLVRVQKGEDTATAARAVVAQTRWPLLGGTIVGFLAFSPIGFSPDNTGEFAGSLFWTISIALLFSWLVAVWLTPYFCTLLLKPSDAEPKQENIILRWYRNVLTLAIRRRYVTVLAVVALFASSILGYSMVPAGFFPASTRAQFIVDYSLPEGTDIHTTQADVLQIAEHVRTLGGVTGTNTVIGGGHARFMLTYAAADASAAYGQILVDVEEYKLIDTLRADIQQWIDARYPNANAKVSKFVLGPGGGAKIEARFFGPDPSVLRALSEQAKDIMANAGGIGIQDDWGNLKPILRPVIDTENARRLGLTQGEISNAFYSHLEGSRIGVYREAGELRPIIMRPYEASRDDVAKLRDVQVFSQITGGYIPVAQVVDRFNLVYEASNLRSVDRNLAITAQSDTAPGVLSGDLFDAVRAPVEAIDLPPGYTLEWEGEFGSSAEANAGLAATMPLGFGAMIIVVILLFNAVRQPLIIWLTVPLALIGVVWGLVLTQTALEFMAILGVLALAGMLIKNAIVLIDETDSQIDAGRERMQAIIDAAVSRARPVTLGVVTTVLGVVPLLWDPFFQSLAVVIICGLSFATILTLIIVPTLYAIFFRVDMSETPT